MFEIVNQDLQCSWTTSRFYNIFKSVSAVFQGESTVLYRNENIDALDYQDIVKLNHETVTTHFNFKCVFKVTDLPIDEEALRFLIYTPIANTLSFKRKMRLIKQLLQ